MSDVLMSLITNDIVVANGDLSIVSGSDAIAQDWQQQMQVWAGEWFLDNTIGVPYKQTILVKNPNLDLVQAALLTATTNVPGIVLILDFNFNYDNNSRSISVSIVAQTSTGEIISSQTVITLPSPATIEGTPYP